mmetsp:Transcript_22806/g.22023  ORF Transcript_22806/g.22023 Transcript_22806/m.22023 type:complete len:137 (+) Transcript_22806:557-967(+)
MALDENLEENEEMMNTQIEQMQAFLGGDLDIPTSVIKLALKKCNMQLEEALCMLTDEFTISDLQEEVRKLEEAKQASQILIIEEEKKEEEKKGEEQKEDAKINLIISNRKEYFELLFDLLNLGINEITTAAWNLLV